MEELLRSIVRVIDELEKFSLKSGDYRLPEFLSEPQEATSVTPLDARLISKIPRDAEGDAERGLFTLGVDGSSTYVPTPIADVVLASAAAVTESGRALLYPNIAGMGVTAPLERSFIALRPLVESLDERVIMESRVRMKSMTGHPYTADYNISVIQNEVRTSLETGMLKLLVRYIDEVSGLETPLILIDGPLFPIPEVLLHKATGEPLVEEYKKVYARLIGERLDVLSRAESRGIFVAGIVKGFRRSFKLSKVPDIRRVFGRGNDEQILTLIVRRMRVNLNEYVKVGFFRLSYPKGSELRDVLGRDLPEKYFAYIVPPAVRYGVRRAFRVEVLKKTYEALSSIGDIAEIFAELTDPGLHIPLVVHRADELAKADTRKMRELVKSEIEGGGLFVYSRETEDAHIREEVSLR